MSIDLEAVNGPSRLATRRDAVEEEPWRYAGQEFGLSLGEMDIEEGLQNLGLEDLRRLRSDKVVPRTFGSEYGKGLSHYEASGSYQPDIAYGA